MKRLVMVLLFAVIGAAVAGGYWYWQKPAAGDGAGKSEKAKGKGKGRGGPLTVSAVQAVAKPMPVLIDAVGTVEPEQSVQVRAQVSGVLQAVQFKEGDKVKAGQLLFQIDPRTFQAQYNQALAALARDKAQLENAKAQQQRLEPLLKREFITRQEYDVAVTSTKSLEATLQASQAQVEQARIQLDFARITAPISGRTGQLSVKPGNLVGASGGGVPLVTINSTDPVLVSFSIPERQLEDIRRFQNEKGMRIEILPDRAGAPVATGKLVFVDNTVTPQTGTVLLKTRVDNSKEAIWPGQFVNVRVVLTVEPEAVVVPEVAVQPGQDGPFVYLIGAEDKVEIRTVKVSRQIGSEVVIASGVSAGDRIITDIPQALRPGSTVKVADPAADGEKKGKGKGKGKKGENKGAEAKPAEAKPAEAAK
ncbi:MAG: efflux RND transporter periplasmic adaptor subunit [Burkholderiales bacterium]|nr:efflux RND transporter periplasmic adaptor subunit [Burkholderiales bacterium]